MAERKQRQGFVLYHEDLAHLVSLSDEDFRAVIMGLSALSLGEEPKALQGSAQMAYSFMATKVKRDADEYAKRCEKNRRNVQTRYDRIPSNTNVSESYDRIPSNTNVSESYDRIPSNTNATNQKGTGKGKGNNIGAEAPSFRGDPESYDRVNYDDPYGLEALRRGGDSS